MRVLLVHCHPNPDSFNAALRNAAVAALEAAGHAVESLDLYGENFDPRLSARERGAYYDEEAERPDIAWYGDMELGPSVKLFFERGPIDVSVTWGEPVAFAAGTDRKAATALAEASVRRALQEAVTGRPPAPVPEAPSVGARPVPAAPPILIPAATA